MTDVDDLRGGLVGAGPNGLPVCDCGTEMQIDADRPGVVVCHDCKTDALIDGGEQ